MLTLFSSLSYYFRQPLYIYIYDTYIHTYIYIYCMYLYTRFSPVAGAKNDIEKKFDGNMAADMVLAAVALQEESRWCPFIQSTRALLFDCMAWEYPFYMLLTQSPRGPDIAFVSACFRTFGVYSISTLSFSEASRPHDPALTCVDNGSIFSTSLR